MIIASYNLREVSKVYTTNEMRDINGKFVDSFTFRVKRIATRNEYLDYCKETKAPYPAGIEVPYYYEIQTD